MTRENMAIYLTVMARMAVEPYTTVKFVTKYKTEKQREKTRELIESLEELFDIVRDYPRISSGYKPMKWENPAEYWDEIKIYVQGGSWRHKQELSSLTKYLERRKIPYELAEWR